MALGVLGAGVHGQEAPPKVEVRAAYFPGAGGNLELELYTGEGGRSLPVTVWPGKLSPEFELPRLPVWRFGKWETKPDPNREGRTVEVFVERGRAKPVAARRQWVLMLRSSNKEDAPLTVRCYGADNTSMREGGALFLNLTQGPIGVEVAGEKIGIEPGKHRIVNPNTNRGDQYPIALYYQVAENKYRPFVESTWFHGERRRTLAIIMQREGARAPRMFSIPDVESRVPEGE